MKRLTILMMVMLLGAVSLMARPGYSKPVDVKQPDGTTVTLLMHGDEFMSFMTTIDGYTVIKGEDGYYRYAEKQDGKLKATAFIARNTDVRGAQEVAFLSQAKKMVHPDMSAEQRAWKAQAASMYSANYKAMGSSHRAAPAIWDRINYDNFKGLVVLVEWNDRQFMLGDEVQPFYQKMCNEVNLQDESKKYYPVAVTGSTRDYFRDNSLGIFDPSFDVVGPVQINYSCTYPVPKNTDGSDSYGFSNRMINILKAVMNQVDVNVDLSKYDLDNDGYIDMVYFIFAGYGSYVQGNDNRYLWPHANDTKSWSASYGMRWDNKYFGRYACSMEIQDYEFQKEQHVWLDGIGTMCHEFSHVLGLADHYDADYDDNGYSEGTGRWDLMANGADFNYGLTPVGYNAFERYVLGFAEPQTLSEAGKYQLASFDTGNMAFIVNSAKTNEDFYIENRQNQGWDAFFGVDPLNPNSKPQHGMMIWRADVSNPSLWKQNKVNINPNKLNFEVIGYSPFADSDLTAETCGQWGTKGAVIDLYDITEQDGVISFEAGKDVYPFIVEDFEDSPLTTADATGVAGKFCTWDLVNATIAATSGTYGSGSHVAKIGRSGKMTSSVFETGLRTLKFKVQNGSKRISFSLNVNTGDGKWTALGGSSTDIGKNKSQEFSFVNVPAGSQIQFNVLSTSTDAACYIDDIQVSLPKEAAGITNLRRAGNNDNRQYNMAGQRVGAGYKGLVIMNGKKVVKK